MAERIPFFQRLLAVRLARKYRDQFNGDEEQIKAALKEDEQLVGIDPATIILIIELVMAAIKFFRSRKGEETANLSDDDLLALVYEDK
jgi:hypothetical protein